MAILGRFIHRRRAADATQPDPYDTLGEDDTLHAEPRSMKQRLATGGHVALDKATRTYRRSPKLIGGLALVAGAFLLTQLRKGRPAIH